MVKAVMCWLRAYLELVLKEVFLVWQLAVHAEETLLVCGQRLEDVSERTWRTACWCIR